MIRFDSFKFWNKWIKGVRSQSITLQLAWEYPKLKIQCLQFLVASIAGYIIRNLNHAAIEEHELSSTGLGLRLGLGLNLGLELGLGLGFSWAQIRV